MKSVRFLVIFTIFGLFASPAMAWHQGRYHSPSWQWPAYRPLQPQPTRDYLREKEDQWLEQQQWMNEHLRNQRELNRQLKIQNWRNMR